MNLTLRTAALYRSATKNCMISLSAVTATCRVCMLRLRASCRAVRRNYWLQGILNVFVNGCCRCAALSHQQREVVTVRACAGALRVAVAASV